MGVHELGFPFIIWTPSTEKYNFLGISIVGQSNERGDGGIYIGSIMKGGAVAADGRIEPGDMLLQVRWAGPLAPTQTGALSLCSPASDPLITYR